MFSRRIYGNCTLHIRRTYFKEGEVKISKYSKILQKETLKI